MNKAQEVKTKIMFTEENGGVMIFDIVKPCDVKPIFEYLEAMDDEKTVDVRMTAVDFWELLDCYVAMATGGAGLNPEL